MRLFRQPYAEISDEEAEQNAKPRRGVSGFFETLIDYFTALVKANLLMLMCLLPTLLLYLAARMVSTNIFVVSAAGMLGAAPAGAGLCGLNAVVCQSIRNRGFVFSQVFRRHFQENLLRGILPGCLYILSLECTLYLFSFYHTLETSGTSTAAMLCTLIIAIRLLLAYLLPMMTLLELPMRHYLRNSLLLIPACPKASFGVLLTTSTVYLFTVLFLPYTGIYIIFLAFALHALIAQLWSWPALDRTLSIEEREARKNNRKES